MDSWVCIECLGLGKKSHDIEFVCFRCTSAINIPPLDPNKPCDACKGKGYLQRNIVINCKYCKGTGYRNWIDYIKRPSEKERGLSCFV